MLTKATKFVPIHDCCYPICCHAWALSWVRPPLIAHCLSSVPSWDALDWQSLSCFCQLGSNICHGSKCQCAFVEVFACVTHLGFKLNCRACVCKVVLACSYNMVSVEHFKASKAKLLDDGANTLDVVRLPAQLGTSPLN